MNFHITNIHRNLLTKGEEGKHFRSYQMTIFDDKNCDGRWNFLLQLYFRLERVEIEAKTKKSKTLKKPFPSNLVKIFQFCKKEDKLTRRDDYVQSHAPSYTLLLGSSLRHVFISLFINDENDRTDDIRQHICYE